MRRAIPWVLAALAAAAGCGSDSHSGAPFSCEAGREGCGCYGNGTCNAGLTCASQLCVRLADAGDTANTGGAANGGANTGSGGANTGNGGANTGNGGAETGGAIASSGGGSAGTGGTSTDGGAAGSPADGGNPDSSVASCSGAIAVRPEQIVVYRDASFTDTVTTVSPFAMFIMLDRSSSMIGFSGDPSNWPNASSAIQAFVNEPASVGMEVGLGTFPPLSGAGSCDGADCAQPLVPIAPLPDNAPAITAGMTQATPTVSPILFTPTECGLRGMLQQCEQFQASHTGEQCVALIVTDGQPTTCDTTLQNLVDIVATGKAQGVLTFTLGLPGSDLNFLNQLADAGGTTAAVDATAGGNPGQATFLAALDAIRDKIATTVSHVVTTPGVIGTIEPCQWMIPLPTGGQPFDSSHVNLELTLAGVPHIIGHVDTSADCSSAASAWYYDSPASPTRVLLCPQACDAMKSSGSGVELLFGCPTERALP